MAYVYTHTRLDTGEIFYVGVGLTNDSRYPRAYQKVKSKRSKSWLSVVEKTEFKVIIVADNLSIKSAWEKEIELIAFYGRRDLRLGPLVNMTAGGDGVVHISEDERERRRKAKLGKKSSEETKSKISIAKKNMSIDTKKKMSECKKGKPGSRLGKKASQETIDKMKATKAITKRKNTEQAKENMRKAWIIRKQNKIKQ